MLKIEDIENEFIFETARSGGKGGQNVNKIESKVSLVWSFEYSPKLTEKEKRKIKENAKSFLFTNGIRITSQKSRSQLANKNDCIEKLTQLLANWLKEKKKRKPTKISKGAKLRRLKSKKIKSDVKKNRSKPKFDD